MKILIINAGSSSLKYQFMESEGGEVFAKGLCERIGIDGRLTHKVPGREDVKMDIPMPTHSEAIQAVLDIMVDPEKGVIQSTAILREQNGITLRLYGEGAEYVWADEFKTEQVLTNYISNAIHYASGEKRIEVNIQQQEEVVRVEVFNTGSHIPEEDIDQIWDKFYKVDKARTREYGGNGIGLSIVKAIMDSFHRECGVRNEENGVTFWFELDRKNG